MSQIVIEIPTSVLTKPGVVKALTDLVLLLGGHAVEPSVKEPVVTPALLPIDASVKELAPAPAANPTGEADENPTRRAFYAHLEGRDDTAVVKAVEAVNFYHGLEKAGSAGRSTEEALSHFPGIPTGKALGGFLGGLKKGLTNRGLDLPHESRNGRYYIKPWPQA